MKVDKVDEVDIHPLEKWENESSIYFLEWMYINLINPHQPYEIISYLSTHHILFGISTPNNPMADCNTLPTALLNCKRNALAAAVSALKMLKSCQKRW